MKTDQLNKVRQQLDAALSGAANELAEIAAGNPSISTTSELESIRAKLREVLESLSVGKKIETPGLWRIVTDTWPHTKKLRQQLVEAKLNYERLKS